MKISIFEINKEIPETLGRINEVLSPFYEKGYQSFNDIYFDVEDSKNVETFLDDVYNLSHEAIQEAVQMAIDHLIKLDIWDYNIDRFNEEYQDGYYDIDALYEEYFEEKYQNIVTEETNTKIARNIERSQRSSWSGGGFGLSGAIKGAVQAELLNLATDAIRGVNDAAEDASDRSNINKLKKDLLNDKKNLELYLGHLRIQIQNVGWALVDFLTSKGILEKYQFDFETAYARYNNITNSNLTNKEKAAKIIECILMYPYYFEFYGTLYDIEPSKAIYDLAVYFGYIYKIKYKFLDEFIEEWTPVYELPSNSPLQADEKFKAFANLLLKHNFMESGNKWNYEFANSYRIVDFQEELIEVYSTLEKDRRIFNKIEYRTVDEAQKNYEEFIENKRREKELADNIDTAKNLFKKTISLAITAAIIYGIYVMFFKSGMVSGILNMFTSLGN